MKTNNIKNEIELHRRIEKLELENIELREKVNDCTEFIRILEEWLSDTDDTENNEISIDCGTY
jgi:hypothetical protein